MKILIVEDQRLILADYVQALKKNPDINVFTAATLEEARELYGQNQDTDIIVMDFDLGHGINTIPLVKEFKETFKGPIIANSSEKSHNDKLIEVGCTHCSASKNDIPKKIFELITSSFIDSL